MTTLNSYQKVYNLQSLDSIRLKTDYVGKKQCFNISKFPKSGNFLHRRKRGPTSKYM